MSTLRRQVARAFKPLLVPSRYKAAHGGRGSGKSHTFAENAIQKHIEQPGCRGVCIREVQKDLKESAKLLLEDKIKRFDLGADFRAVQSEIRTPGDGLIIFRGMNEFNADSIKSLEGFDWAWVEEGHTLTARSWELLRPTMRKPGSEIWASWNPRHASDPIDAFFRGPTPPENAVIIRANYTDNPWFPPELEEERAYDERIYPARYSHIWEGEYEPQAAGALWDRLTIHQNRRAEAPALTRILVGIDPPVSAEAGSDECGIIVGGIGEDGRGYILEDASMPAAQPEEWAKKAVACYDYYEADAIVAEVNQGGEMVRAVIQAERKGIPVIQVRATRGKHVRAEPISSLYKLGKVSHVGAYPQLEGQLCLFTAAGYEGEGSPDRADAAVWVFTELFPKLTRKTDAGKQRNPQANRAYSPHRWR